MRWRIRVTGTDRATGRVPPIPRWFQLGYSPPWLDAEIWRPWPLGWLERLVREQLPRPWWALRRWWARRTWRRSILKLDPSGERFGRMVRAGLREGMREDFPPIDPSLCHADDVTIVDVDPGTTFVGIPDTAHLLCSKCGVLIPGLPEEPVSVGPCITFRGHVLEDLGYHVWKAIHALACDMDDDCGCGARGWEERHP